MSHKVLIWHFGIYCVPLMNILIYYLYNMRKYYRFFKATLLTLSISRLNFKTFAASKEKKAGKGTIASIIDWFFAGKNTVKKVGSIVDNIETLTSELANPKDNSGNALEKLEQRGSDFFDKKMENIRNKYKPTINTFKAILNHTLLLVQLIISALLAYMIEFFVFPIFRFLFKESKKYEVIEGDEW